MMYNYRKRFLFVGLACAALILLSAPAMASPIIGTLQLNGTFTEGLITLNFCASGPSCPAAPGNWNVPASPGNGTGDLTGSDLGGGLITNLSTAIEPVGTLLPGNGVLFTTFVSSPDIQFYITEVFAGVGGTANCGAVPAPGQTCTPVIGGQQSSVTFLNGQGGDSSATITAQGVARRISTDEFDALQMVFTSQFNTPFQTVLSNFSGGGNTLTNTYSATFTASVVPEPMTLSLLGLGLMGLGMFRRRMVR